MTVDHVERDASCLREIRAELTATYPRVRAFNVIRILRRHGLSRFPAGLLLDAPTLAAGPRSALALLLRAGHPRFARGLQWHPLFSADFYEGVNPDVVAGGANPWLHYQVHGRTEGRSPHPLIDIDYLSAGIPGALRSELVDSYLGTPALWRLDPGPYVECTRFLLSGPWDGSTNPLQQIVRDHLSSPWVHQRLMLVDAQAAGSARGLLVAAAVLLTRHAASGLGALQLWRAPGTVLPSGTADYTVVPGMFVGSGAATLVAQGSAVMSADTTVLRAGDGFASLRSGHAMSVASLVIIDTDLDDAALSALVGRGGSLALAPHSLDQHAALQRIAGGQGVRILQPGLQVHVTADELEVVAA